MNVSTTAPVYRWVFRGVVPLLSAVLLLLHGGPPAGAAERLVVTGASTIAPVIVEMGKRFEERHPDVRVDVQTGGSSRGVRDARQGLSDIGMVSRELKADEGDLTPFTIALDGVAVIINAANAVQSLTTEQIVGIYTGAVRDWAEVGGKPGRIVVVNKAAGRSTLEVFCEFFRLTPEQIRADVVIGDNEQGIKTVAGSPGSIGYVSIGTAIYNASAGVPIRLLPVGGVEATREAVAARAFPVLRPLNLVTKGTPEGIARDFIAFAQSEEVHDIVEDLYFVPVQ